MIAPSIILFRLLKQIRLGTLIRLERPKLVRLVMRYVLSGLRNINRKRKAGNVTSIDEHSINYSRGWTWIKTHNLCSKKILLYRYR